jgi:glutathione S-transferase
VARYTAEERARMAIADLDAVVAQLGASPFLFGDRPCTADATLFGFTCQWLWTPFDGPLQRHARAQSALVAWAERVRDRYWTKVPPLT